MSEALEPASDGGRSTAACAAEDAGQHAGGTAAAKGKAKGKAKAKSKRGPRAQRPQIDLDDAIAEAREAAKAAGKALTAARAQQRTERKKRARLIKKAGQLTSTDLERIAVLKRSGFWDPESGNATLPGDEGDAASAAAHAAGSHGSKEERVGGAATPSTGSAGSSTPAGATMAESRPAPGSPESRPPREMAEPGDMIEDADRESPEEADGRDPQ